MREIAIDPQVPFQVARDTVCRLLAGGVDLQLNPEEPPIRFYAGGWDFFYWGIGVDQDATIFALGTDARIAVYDKDEIMASAVGYCRLLAHMYEHFLLLRLNLFSYDRHVRQVLKYYFDNYHSLCAQIAEDVTQQQLSILQKDLDLKDAIREHDSQASSFEPRECNLGNTVIFSRGAEAVGGVYVVREGDFYLMLDDVEVLSFRKDQVVYLPSKVIDLPGYMSSNFQNLQQVAAGLDEFTKLLQTCPRVAERFIKQYSVVAGRLLHQCSQLYLHCQHARKKIFNPDHSEKSLHGFLTALSQFIAPESFLAGYASKVRPLITDALLAANKLQEEEDSLFRT